MVTTVTGFMTDGYQAGTKRDIGNRQHGMVIGGTNLLGRVQDNVQLHTSRN